jgi:excisionase family DNA binding protein
MSESQLVNIVQACTLTGVSRRTIYNWLNKGLLRYTRTAGGSVRIYRESLWRHPDESAQKEQTNG